MYGQQNKKLKIEIWSLFCMDLQKEQDWNVHDSGWMLVICKHLNWNWYWNWEYYISLTKGGDIQHPPSYVTFWSRGYMTNVKPYIYLSTIPIATKIDRVVTYGGETQPSKSHDFFITWSRGKWKKLLSALSQYLWSSNLVEW